MHHAPCIIFVILCTKITQSRSNLGQDREQTEEVSSRREIDMVNGVTLEETTARIWREVASSIIKGIMFTIEMPEDHENGMVPVLDVQARLIREKLGVDPDDEMIYQDRVEFKFYKKPTANWLLLEISS